MKLIFRIVVIVLFTTTFVQKVDAIQFRSFELNDKLPSNSVHAVFKDSEGFVWIGTHDGLCRYDGHEIKTFRANPFFETGLSNNVINAIVEDNDRQIWIATNEGINLLNKRDLNIYTIDHPILSKVPIVTIIHTQNGEIWAGTNQHGIFRIKPDGTIIQYSKQIGLQSNDVTFLYQDSNGNVWATFWMNGMTMFNPATNQFHILPFLGKSNAPFRIIEDRRNEFIVTTWGDGIFHLDLKELDRNPYKKIDCGGDENLIAYSIVKDDKYNYYWLINFNGVSILERTEDYKFDKVTEFEQELKSVDNLYHSVYKDDLGSIWFGTIRSGIDQVIFNDPFVETIVFEDIRDELGAVPDIENIRLFNDSTLFLYVNRVGIYLYNTFTKQIQKPYSKFDTALGTVTAVGNMHSENSMLLVTPEDGIFKLKQNLEIEVVNSNIDNYKTIGRVNVIFEDANHNIWLGGRKGLFRFTSEGDIENINVAQYIISIAEDQLGNIWVGTEHDGLFKVKLIKQDNSDIKAKYSTKHIEETKNSSVQCIHVRENNELYVGTLEGSIFIINEDSKVVDINKKYFIVNSAIHTIKEDKYGMVWISTIKEIIQYNPLTNEFHYYNKDNGIDLKSLGYESIATNDGPLYFAGYGGICSVHANLNRNQENNETKVYITDIYVGNKPVFSNEYEKYYQRDENRLILGPDDPGFSVTFSSLNSTSNEKLIYAYRLKGVENNWSYTANDRSYISYSNLKRGDYLLEIIVYNEHKKWSNSLTTLKIYKEPPFYLTNWAFFIYSVLLVFIISMLSVAAVLFNNRRIEKIEQIKSEEITQIKLNYFTNISHDLLTPLSIISLLADELSQSADKKAMSKIIKHNVTRLKRLIQQVLEFRKVDSGKLQLRIIHKDIVTFIKEHVLLGFQPILDEKGITISVKSEFANYDAFFDPDKIDKVLYNLVSNAIKFTKVGGEVEVILNFETADSVNWIKIEVKDTGIGIEKSELKKIFDRFYIVKNANKFESNGIGLALCKDLVEIHKGSISVKSEINVGSSFFVNIPVSKNVYSKSDLEIEDIEITNDQQFSKSKEEDEVFNTLLLVEDNLELLNFVADKLESRYKVYKATNGFKALELVRENSIDAIVSDVMMPKMNGVELCKEIKSDLETSHIPILLLTAKTSSKAQVDYFNAGAEAFMPKPFKMDVLLARIENMLQKRIEKQEAFKQNPDISLSSMNVGKLDEEFLTNAIAIIEQNMSDFSFDSNALYSLLNCSQSTLYRKLKSLTGLSPNGLISSVRLKLATDLLHNSRMQITEIAYKVGIEPKTFTRKFKAHFNCTPSKFRQEKTGN